MDVKLILLAVVCVVVPHVHGAAAPAPTATQAPTMWDHISKLEKVVENLSRQVMLQQFYVEEKARSDGNSGLKQTRLQSDGTKNYYQTAHIGRAYMSIHDHANYDRTIGMGELYPVMNGIEFRTRHNDYKLRMPHRTSKNFNAMEDIPFPQVPASVKNKHTVAEQVAEMREYFKAFSNQDSTHRNYKPYFKPVLCYLEGGWQADAKTFSEPFQSDRHSIDATGWFDLMDKIRYTAYSGSKSVLENYAYLPTKIMGVTDDGLPQIAQWNYRILCAPLKDDLPTAVFHQVDDLLYRFPQHKTMNQLKFSRAARFVVNEKNLDHFDNANSLIDRLMAQIPGKNNYPANLNDNSFDQSTLNPRMSNNTNLNTGYYHRSYKTENKGAMGLNLVHRGFNDANLWVAQTTQENIAPMSVESCTGRGHARTCKTFTTRYTYALPLEIIYMTPLSLWNPYNVKTDSSYNDITSHSTRNGQMNAGKAFNGTNSKYYYITPSEFYSGQTLNEHDPADTRKGAGVLDRQGKLHSLFSAGTRVVTPSIADIGQVRLRYPIMPVYGEGSGVWKELNALKDMTMHLNRWSYLYEERPGATATAGNGTQTSNYLLHYQTTMTYQDPPGEHQHDFFITNEELDEIKHGRWITVTTSEDLGHTHDVTLKWVSGHLRIIKCDNMNHCWDGHSTNTIKV